MKPIEYIPFLVTLFIALPPWLINVRKWFKERNADKRDSIVKDVSPDLMVVGVSTGLATSLYEVLQKERASWNAEDARKDARILQLETEVSVMRNTNWALQDEVRDLRSANKLFEDRLARLEGK